MKLTHNKLKQLINEVLEEASEKAPFGPFSGSKPYVASQRAAKLPGEFTKKMALLDKDSGEQSKSLDQSLGIDNPDSDIKTPVSVLQRQEEFREIIANQHGNIFSENEADASIKVNTEAIGDAYRIGTWSHGNYSGGIFANKTGIYILSDDGAQTPFTPKNHDRSAMPITKSFNEIVFMGMFERRKR